MSAHGVCGFRLRGGSRTPPPNTADVCRDGAGAPRGAFAADGIGHAFRPQGKRRPMYRKNQSIRNQKSEIHGVYARGASGGDHDHRHPDRAVAAGGAGGPRGGPADAVQEQPQATRPGLPEPRATPRAGFPPAAGGTPGPATPTAAPTGGSRAAGSTTSCPTSSSKPLHDLGAGLAAVERRRPTRWPPTCSGWPFRWACSIVPRGGRPIAYPWTSGLQDARRSTPACRPSAVAAAITPPTAATCTPIPATDAVWRRAPALGRRPGQRRPTSRTPRDK